MPERALIRHLRMFLVLCSLEKDVESYGPVNEEIVENEVDRGSDNRMIRDGLREDHPPRKP